MKILKLILIFLSLTLCSCSTTNYTKQTNVIPVNIIPKNKSWLIEIPVLKNINSSFEYETLSLCKDILKKKKFNIQSITDYKGFNSFSKLVDDNLQILDLYKEKYPCDYIIIPYIETTKSQLSTVRILPDNEKSNEISIHIRVYNVKNKNIVCDIEYLFIHSFDGRNDINFSQKLEKFIKKSIQSAFKEFGSNYNWKFTN